MFDPETHYRDRRAMSLYESPGQNSSTYLILRTSTCRFMSLFSPNHKRGSDEVRYWTTTILPSRVTTSIALVTYSQVPTGGILWIY